MAKILLLCMLNVVVASAQHRVNDSMRWQSESNEAIRRAQDFRKREEKARDEVGRDERDRQRVILLRMQEEAAREKLRERFLIQRQRQVEIDNDRVEGRFDLQNQREDQEREKQRQIFVSARQKYEQVLATDGYIDAFRESGLSNLKDQFKDKKAKPRRASPPSPLLDE